MDKKSYIRLPLKNAYNVRDLGGYSCFDGKITNSNTFLRGDSLASIDNADIDFLLEYGLTSVVDLRSEREVRSHPNPFAGVKGVSYNNIQLMTGNIDDVSLTGAEVHNRFIPEFYLGLLKNSQSSIRDIFSLFGEQKGCTLFHCAAGKDRTGIVAMLLLGLAGVSRSDVVANYQVTYTYIKESPHARKAVDLYPPQTMYSLPAYIEEAMDYISEDFGGTEDYLRALGMGSKAMGDIRGRLRD